MEHPGIRLKRLREARGLSIEELLVHLNFKPKTRGGHFLMLRAWEYGRGCLWDTMTEALAKFFGVTTDYLLGL